jgi:hypothetical protein
MRTLVMPVFQDLTLREIGVSRCNQFNKYLTKQSDSRAKQTLGVGSAGLRATPRGS